MFDPRLCDRRLAQQMDVLRQRRPSLQAADYTPAEALAWVARLDGKADKPLSHEEQDFVVATLARSKSDFRWWAERYAYVKTKELTKEPMRLWDSQRFILDKVAEREWLLHSGGSGNMWFQVNKGRQLGASSLIQALIAHKTFFYGNVNGLIAADVQGQSAFLFDMLERTFENLPWWMSPRKLEHTKSEEIKFSTDSNVWVGWGKSKRGAKTASGSGSGELGRGRSQPLDAKVLTPNGWKRMGDIKLYDLVIGSDGKPTVVTGVFPQGELPVYRVTCSDGSSTECSADHLWSVKVHRRANEDVRSEVLTTQQMIDGGLRGHKDIWKYELPRVKPVVGYSDTLPLDPYVLGALLGDGGMTTGRVYLTSMDMDIVNRVQYGLPAGHTMSARTTSGKATTYNIVGGGRGGKNKVCRALTTLGLMGHSGYTKFIPECYLTASPHARLEILRGLMDTDGWVTRTGEVGISSISQQLAEGVRYLVRSLGGHASCRLKPVAVNSFDKIKHRHPSWCVRITLPKGMTPFHLARKADIYDNLAKNAPYCKVRAIELAGVKPCQCISVAAEDSLYVTDDFIVTHNTIHVAHLSEISTWEDPGQITDALEPALSKSRNAFCAMESSPKGRNWWYQKWQQSVNGLSDWVPVFVGWYTEPSLRLAPPEGWEPLADTKAHAAHVERVSAQWNRTTIRLTREQMYWWERKYLTAKEDRTLYKFLAEFAADPETCFTLADTSVFSTEALLEQRSLAKPLQAVVEVYR